MKKQSLIIYILAIAFLGACQNSSQTSITQTEQWDLFELELKGPASGNPYLEVDLSAIFSLEEEQISVPGFYDGDSIYRIRFSPPSTGQWTYVTESNLEELSGKTGKLNCVPPSEGNHGPLQVVNTFSFEYADGTPFFPIGTTAYQWTSADQELQEKTIETLKTSPFNKVRMLFLPKHHTFGNETEPWMHAFKRENNKLDFTQPEYEFFRNFDKRIAQLRDMGIEADVILFHPYDNWGYKSMGHDNNERYVRYLMARLSAYRNVWWSLANEYAEPRIRDEVDWEGIGVMLHKEDPHQRLRSIHNWRSFDEFFYDHTREWITHVSTQTSEFYNAIKWRERYQKPLLFDEMRYEGDIPKSWGDLTGEQMASYFWMASLSGGFPMHSDTYINSENPEDEVRWWGKGGTLPGTSPERIAFFKSVIEQVPYTEMTPGLIGDTPLNRNSNVYVFSKPGSHYLIYTANEDKVVELNLEGTSEYKLEVLDTWNMQTVKDTTVQPGTFTFRTTMPYTALHIFKD